jgi:hypothetical protein
MLQPSDSPVEITDTMRVFFTHSGNAVFWKR